ncbi:MAG: tRNA pseudouridine(55) synthase TruB [Candidatus Eisenbacteria bacterium]|uniref:tRNA pseudouridine synthase B n=1 Tax=Eiseniibacteriota bacterium TaxID=2212470 RepID=A0A948RYL3_UNCEI|nr:tRNA pseudouridine(55) synthase TruB [Candidatus Eisenbacteria bacterium]MBU1951194.1 tRNA pseudouridine(55) synthase TruB [Candidatus Eisenbacteria bacterium]MBU2690619.1 tRNA pseudouridine(55) synthase TruB [Candidatus Eisenbacteria bacterium]
MNSIRSSGYRMVRRTTRRRQERADGEVGYVLPVMKHSGCTSHDVVAQLRQLLGIRKIGHSGTLDPFATGLLVCCVGRATKLSNYLMDLDKTYEGDLKLGVRTHTGDRTGDVIAEAVVPHVTIEQCREAAGRFEGEQLQIPPMMSALKYKGRRLYELAREGMEVERTPRKVKVHEFHILEILDHLIRFRVRCGRGTYVRTLVEDFGRALGTEATVEELARTAIGGFTLEGACDQAEIRAGDLDAVGKMRVEMAEALGHLRHLTLTGLWIRRVRQGTPPPLSVFELNGDPPKPGEVLRLLGTEGSLVALGRIEPTLGPADRPWHESGRMVIERVL